MANVKNKKLLTAVLAVFVLLVFSVYQEMQGEPKTTNSTAGKLKSVGVLQFVSHPALDDIYLGIKKGLKDEGFTLGKDLKINFKNAQGDQSKLMLLSDEIIAKRPDAVIGIATPAAQALANQTSSVPIILGAVTDPVSAKLVKSEKKPGKNITGVSDKSPVRAQFIFAKEILENAKTVGILYSSAEDNSKFQVAEAKSAAVAVGLSVKESAVPSANEVSAIVGVLAREVDFIYVPNDNTLASAMQTIVKTADENKIPVIPAADTMVKDGGLATVGLNQFQLGVRTGKMTASIIKGQKKPATTPIFTFKTGEKIVNVKKAKALGIKIKRSILDQAQRVGDD